jgi:glycosyltransferase involved in cell wall biosynthesis
MGFDDVVDAYHAMDVFAFASRSETQGMVLTEAAAAGVPIVALDAPGVREVVVDNHNGRLLAGGDVDDMVEALLWMARQPPEAYRRLRRHARETADLFSMDRMTRKALSIYERLIDQALKVSRGELNAWDRLLGLVRAEWALFKGMAEAAESVAEDDIETT